MLKLKIPRYRFPIHQYQLLSWHLHHIQRSSWLRAKKIFGPRCSIGVLPSTLINHLIYCCQEESCRKCNGLKTVHWHLLPIALLALFCKNFGWLVWKRYVIFTHSFPSVQAEQIYQPQWSFTWKHFWITAASKKRGKTLCTTLYSCLP